MFSFVYGYALGAPILGKYFELPKKNPINHKIIFDEDFKSITDVFAYRYIDTEKYVVKDIQPFKTVDDLLETIKKSEPEEQNTDYSQ